jgi:hypothetical protein
MKMVDKVSVVLMEWNIINKINKERRRSMNGTPTRPSNKNRWHGTQEALKQKQDSAQCGERTSQSLIIK